MLFFRFVIAMIAALFYIPQGLSCRRDGKVVMLKAADIFFKVFDSSLSL